MSKKKITKTRQKLILNKLESDGRVNVSDLSDDLEVSPVTIRRDLESLSQKGLLDRTHGGARLTKNLRAEDQFLIKGQSHTLEKVLIGKAAADMVENDSTIFFNSGSTTLELYKHLKDKHVRVITNNLATVALARDPSVELFLLGGECREASQSLVGDIAMLTLSQAYSSYTFLGVNGIDSDVGITSSVQQETSVNRLMAERCHGTVVIVADSSKIGVISNFMTLPLDGVDVLITDDGADPEIIEQIRSKGLRVVTCSKEHEIVH